MLLGSAARTEIERRGKLAPIVRDRVRAEKDQRGERVGRRHRG